MSSIAVGFRVGLETRLDRLGRAIAARPLVTLLSVTLVCAALSSGIFVDFRTETRVSKLWVQSGGRVDRENEYIDRYSTDDYSVGTNLLIVTAKDGGDVLRREVLEDLLTLQRRMEYVSVDVDGMNFSHSGLMEANSSNWGPNEKLVNKGDNTDRYLCDKVPLPLSLISDAMLPILNELQSCVRVTILDCFKEGKYDWFVNDLLRALQSTNPEVVVGDYKVMGYDGVPYPGFPDSTAVLPSIAEANESEIRAAVSDGCRGYIRDYMEFPVPSVLGGVEYDDEGIIKSAEALQVVVRMGGLKLINMHTSYDVDVLDRAQNLWVDEWEKVMHETGDTLTNANVAVLNMNAFSKVLEDVSRIDPALVATGYGLMILFIAFSLSGLSDQSRPSIVIAGLVGLLCVLLANMSALGLFLYTGQDLNAAILQVLPFLALGLGVDDLFVLLDAYRNAPRAGLPVDTIVGGVMGEAATSVTLTSFCNATGFFMGVLIPIPAIQAFCIAAGIVVLFNYAILLLCTPAVMAIDADGFGVSSSATNSVKPSDESLNAGDPRQDDTDGRNGNCVQRFITGVYAPVLQKRSCKVLGVLAFVVLNVACALGISYVEDGLDITDIIPEENPAYQAVMLRMKYFALEYGSVYFQGGAYVDGDENTIDYTMDYTDPKVQKAMLEMMEGLSYNHSDNAGVSSEACRTDWDPDDYRGCVTGWYIGDVNSWLKEVIAWVAEAPCTAASDKETCRGQLTDDGVLAPTGFYEAIEKFSNRRTGNYVTTYNSGMLQYAFLNDTSSPQNGNLVYSFNSFQIYNALSTPDKVDVIEKVRAYLDPYCKPDNPFGLKCFVQGQAFTYWEQYIGLKANFWMAFAICEAAIFCATCSLLLSVVVALFVSASSTAIVIQVFGSMALFDIKFSAVPAVTLIMSIGIAVEFTAHICTVFESSVGTRDERMAKALEVMIVPVMQGAISSLLSFLCLGLSNLAFIVKYYFTLYALLIGLGVLNGVFFLPVFLSLIGPNGDAISKALAEARATRRGGGR